MKYRNRQKIKEQKKTMDYLQSYLQTVLAQLEQLKQSTLAIAGYVQGMEKLKQSVPASTESQTPTGWRELYEQAEKSAVQILAAVMRSDQGETWEQQKETIKKQAVELTATVMRFQRGNF